MSGLAVPADTRWLRIGTAGRVAALITSNACVALDLSTGRSAPLGPLDETGDTDAVLGRNDEWIAQIQPDCRAVVFNATSGQLEKIILAGAAKFGVLAMTENGTFLATYGTNRTARVFSMDTGQLERSLPTRPWPPTKLAFSPDGTLLAVALDRAYSVEIWDWKAGSLVSRLEGHRAPIVALVFLRDRRRIVTGAHEAAVRLWDIESGRELQRFQGQLTATHCLAISPDGSRLAGSGTDGVIRLWDLPSGQQVGALRSSMGYIDQLAFDTPGTRLVSGSEFGIHFWDAPAVEASSPLPLPAHQLRHDEAH